MTMLKYHDGTNWVRAPIVAGPPGALGQPKVGGLLAVQRQWGRQERWQVSHASNIPIWCNSDGSQQMTLTYTPVVPCWWDVSANIGLIYATNASYQYRQPYLRLGPVDADGFNASYQYEMQHSQVQTYTFSQLQRTWKLNPGVTYVCDTVWYAAGGTWDIYQGPGQLHMEGKVYSR